MRFSQRLLIRAMLQSQQNRRAKLPRIARRTRPHRALRFCAALKLIYIDTGTTSFHAIALESVQLGPVDHLRDHPSTR